MEFKKKNTFSKRSNESARIKKKYPDRTPIIVTVGKDLPPLDKSKYLVPQDLTVGEFQYVIRKRIQLTPEKAIFFFINNSLVPISRTVREIYNDYADEDGFLYILIMTESTFGTLEHTPL